MQLVLYPKQFLPVQIWTFSLFYLPSTLQAGLAISGSFLVSFWRVLYPFELFLLRNFLTPSCFFFSIVGFLFFFFFSPFLLLFFFLLYYFLFLLTFTCIYKISTFSLKIPQNLFYVFYFLVFCFSWGFVVVFFIGNVVVVGCFFFFSCGGFVHFFKILNRNILYEHKYTFWFFRFPLLCLRALLQLS